MAPARFLRPSRPGAAYQVALCLCLFAQPLVGCAELGGAAQPGGAVSAAASRGAGAAGAAPASAAPAVSPDLLPAPAVFEATGTAVWDGRRTPQGVWVAHPQASTARRVRIYNTATGAAADGALFARDAVLSGPTMLVSSDAARLLGLAAGEEAGLRVVAVTPRAAGAGDLLAAAPAALSDPAAAPPGAPRSPAAPAAVPPAAAPSAVARRPDAPRAVASPAAPARGTVAPNPARAADGGTAAHGDFARAGSAGPPGAAPSRAGAASDVPGRAPAVPPPEQPVRAPSGTEPSPGPAPAGGQRAAGSGQEQAAGPGSSGRKPAAPAVAIARPASVDGGPQDDAQAASAAAAAGAAPGDDAGALAQPYVQAGLFTVAGNAERLIQRIEAAGLPALGKPVQLATGPATRVLAGPFATAAERDAARRRIRAMGLDDAIPVAR